MVKYAIVRDTGVVWSSGIAMSIDDVIPVDGMAIVELAEESIIPIPDRHSVDIDTGEIADLGEPIFAVRQRKQDELGNACNGAIRSGFNSSALGSVHKYPAEVTDQSNMQRVALAGGYLWCAVDDVWAFEAHTAEQGLQVMQDFGSSCDAARENLSIKLALVAAATSAEDINLISWSDSP